MSTTCVPGSDTASGLPPWPARKRASANANSCVLVGGGGTAGISGEAAPPTGPILDVCTTTTCVWKARPCQTTAAVCVHGQQTGC